MAVQYFDLLLQEDVNWGIGPGTKRNPGGGSLVGTQLGIHSLAIGHAAVSALWSPPAVAALESTSTTVTVTGAALGDFVLASFNFSLSGLILLAQVSAVNIVTITLFNPTSASVSLTTSLGAVRVLVFKSR